MSLQIYDDYFSYVSTPDINYKYIHNDNIKQLVEMITNLRKQIMRDGIEDELIIDTFDLYRGYMFECISSLINYDELNWDIDKIKMQLTRIKKRFPSYFPPFFAIGKMLNSISLLQHNDLFEVLRKEIAKNPNKNIAIVSKRNLSLASKERIKRLFVIRVAKKQINFFNNSSFKKTKMKFDLTIFLGGERAHESYVNNCLKAPQIYFLSYDAFYNGYTYKGILDKMQAHSTMFKPLIETKSSSNQYPNQDEIVNDISLNEAKIQRYMQSMYGEDNNQTTREVKVVTAHLVLLEDEKGVLLRRDKEYEVVNLDDKGELEKKKVDEIEIGEYIIINNKSDMKLKNEIALKILGKHSKEVEKSIWMWKQRIIELVENEGIEVVSKRLSNKGIRASSPVNIKYWMSEYSILPDDDYILDVLGFNTKEKENILQAAKSMNSARIKAGRYIFNQLRVAIDKLNLDEIIEEGHQNFEVEELKGASFSIERVIGFSRAQYEVASNKTGQIFRIK